MDFKPGDRVQFTRMRTRNGGLPLVEIQCRRQSATVAAQVFVPPPVIRMENMRWYGRGIDMAGDAAWAIQHGTDRLDHSQLSADQMINEK